MPDFAAYCSALASRVGGKMALIDLPITPLVNSANNPTFNDAVGWALSRMGVPPADPSAVSDADCRAAPDFYLAAELGEYRTLKSIWGNFAFPNMTYQDRSDEFKGISEEIVARLAAMEKDPGLKPYLTYQRATGLRTGAIQSQHPDPRLRGWGTRQGQPYPYGTGTPGGPSVPSVGDYYGPGGYGLGGDGSDH